jgi:hypothetical protein
MTSDDENKDIESNNNLELSQEELKPSFKKRLNDKIKFIIIYIVLIILNCLFGLITWGGVVINIILIVIIYFVIVKVEGMYKYG